MFEEYLQDAYYFLITAEKCMEQKDNRGAKRYYRASVFYTAGAIEAFINYIADSFAKAGSILPHEISFLNDKSIVYAVDKGVHERSEFHRLDEKTRLLLKKFVPDFDFQQSTWVKFMEFKDFRDSLVHPRQVDDEMPLKDYQNKVRAGLKAIIEIMNTVNKGVFRNPLRKQLLDLIPE